MAGRNHLSIEDHLAAEEPLEIRINGNLSSVSAPSSLAVKLAREMSLNLIGFLRDRRFVIYSNPQRCLSVQSRTV